MTTGAAATVQPSGTLSNDYSTIDGPSSTAASSTSKRGAATTKKNKVYRKSLPPPKLQQIQFPARSTTVRPKKTYGKKQRNSLPASILSTSKKDFQSSQETLKQSTLTQIGWVPSTYPEDDEDDEDEIKSFSMDLIGDESSSNRKGLEDTKKTQTKKTSGKKRRKTTGVLELEEDGDEVGLKSSFHTQTLTQMPSWRHSEEDEDDEHNFIENSGDEHAGGCGADLGEKVTELDDVYSTTPPSNKRKRKIPSPSPGKNQTVPQTLPCPSSLDPQTPGKQRDRPAEIPSSQPSPFTPNFAVERRYWSPLSLNAQGTDRTPLKAKSTKVDAPTPTASGRVLKRTKSEIPDSWSTVNGGLGSGSLKRTPLKEITPANKGGDISVHLGDFEDGIAEDQADDQPFRRSQRSLDEVIVDSDEEFGVAEDEAGFPGTPTPLHPPITQNVEKTNPGAGGDGRRDAEAPIPSVPNTTPRYRSSHPVTRSSKTPEPPVDEDESEPETPTHPRAHPSSFSAVEKDTPLSSPEKASPGLPAVSQLGYRSQAFESQRVPFEAIRQMAPQTDRSDIIISIHPEHVKNITDGRKTHEFRDYRISPTVSRIWIYMTRPVCQLKYMAIISGAKEPGEISSEDHGIGNKEFNEGKKAKFAYELKQVYQLNNPVSLERMKQNGWVGGAPQKYIYVPPAVLGELMGNLQRALFLEPGEAQSSLAPMSISQELEEQLRTDIAQSTQVMQAISSPQRQQHEAGEDENGRGVLACSQDDEHVAETPTQPQQKTRQTSFAKPIIRPSRSQHSGVQMKGSPPVIQRSESYKVIRSTVHPSQATTASASSQSQNIISQLRAPGIQTQSQRSIPISPPARKRIPESSSLPGLADDVDFVDDSPIQRVRDHGNDYTQSTLGLGLLGSSQAFGLMDGVVGEQDSLMDDSKIRRPPSEVIWDSDGEAE